MLSSQKPKQGYKLFKLSEHSRVILSVIPEDWDTTTLGRITEPITKGTTPSTEGEKFAKEGILFFKVENILDRGIIDITKTSFITTTVHQKLKRSQLKENDVLFTIAGTLGRTGRIRKEHLPANINQAIAIIRIMCKNYNYDFLEFFLRSLAIKKQIFIEKTVLAQPNLNLAQVSNLKIIKPKVSEQQKIASILSNVDNLIDSFDKTIKTTKKLKTGLMRQLLTKGINHTKFKVIQFGMKWMKIEIPIEWEFRKLNEVAKFRQGLQIAKEMRYKEYKKGRIKLIKILDFYSDKESDEYLDIPSESMKSVICDKNDIIVARTGNTLGMIMTDVEGVFHNNTFALDYDRNLFEKMFFFYLLKSEHVQLLMKIISTRTGQPDLTHKEFSILRVPIPPINEQQKIISILNEINSKIRDLESNQNHLKSIKKGLMQKLLTGQIRVKI